MKRDIVIFGASLSGQIAFDLLCGECNILYFCDNDPGKWGKNLKGREIVNPQRLRTLNNIRIIIASSYFRDIAIQLQNMGMDDYKIFTIDTNFLTKEDIDGNNKDNDRYLLNCYTNDVNGCIISQYNLHIMPDSIYSKNFIKVMNKIFDKSKNLFVIIKQRNGAIKYMDDVTGSENVEILSIKDSGSKLFFYVKNARRVYMHFLSDAICEFFCNYDLPDNVELNWIVWGADIYNYINFEIYDKITAKYIKERCTQINDYNFYKGSYKEKFRISIIKRINNILTWNEGDYNLIKNNFDTDANWIYFFYPSPVDFNKFDKLSGTKLRSKYYLKDKYEHIIMLGNSGDPSNNHLDVLINLRDKFNGNFCIMAPLSYGDKNYISMVIEEGKKILGDRFIPILDYLPEQEYYQLLSQISAAIMNHNRQQAVGNMWILLYLGKKIFMKTTTTTYKVFKDMGIDVFDVNNLYGQDIKSAFELRDSIREKNRNNVVEHFGNTAAVNCIKEVFR